MPISGLCESISTKLEPENSKLDQKTINLIYGLKEIRRKVLNCRQAISLVVYQNEIVYYVHLP